MIFFPYFSIVRNLNPLEYSYDRHILNNRGTITANKETIKLNRGMKYTRGTVNLVQTYAMHVLYDNLDRSFGNGMTINNGKMINTFLT